MSVRWKSIPEEDATPLVVRELNQRFRATPYLSDADLALSTAFPATASDPGTPGQTAYSATHFYVCVATDTWKRVALSSF
jgi:hypothetical protein